MLCAQTGAKVCALGLLARCAHLQVHMPISANCASAAFRDGESLQDGTFFGQAVANADDGNCRFIFNGSSVVEGTSMRGAGAVTYLYFHRSYASPTISPTTTFCDINGIIDGETAFVLSFTLLCFSGFILVAGVVLWNCVVPVSWAAAQHNITLIR